MMLLITKPPQDASVMLVSVELTALFRSAHPALILWEDLVKKVAASAPVAEAVRTTPVSASATQDTTELHAMFKAQTLTKQL
jgi:hypothetical protein